MAEPKPQAIEWDDAAAEPIEWDDAAAEAVQPPPAATPSEAPVESPGIISQLLGTAGGITPESARDVVGGEAENKARARGALKGSSLNWAERFLAAAEAGLPPRIGQLTLGEMVDPSIPTPPPVSYDEALRRWRQRYEETRQAAPGDFLAGELGGGVATSWALPGGAASNIAQGVAAGLGNTEDLATPEAGRDAVVGGLLAYGGQQLGEAGGQLIGKGARGAGQAVRRLATGLVEPSPAARYLEQQGVKNLTIGQMAPKSFLAQMEEAGTSTAGIGPSIKGQRDAALAGVQQAALREALPPGLVEVPAGAKIGDQIGAIKRGYRTAYDMAKGYEVEPDSVRQALDAVDDPAIYADDALRAKVSKWLTNQMTAIRLRGPNGGAVTDDVLSLRSNLRELASSAQTAEERALLRAAEDEVTRAIDGALPEDVQAALRATDQQYAKFRTVADANWSAKDQSGGFTTNQLSTAVRENTPARLYEEGGGGPLRQLASAAEESVAPKIPLTGLRLLSTGPVPYFTGPLSYMANLHGPKRALLGQTEFQQALSGADWLQQLAATDPQVLGRWGAYLGAAASRTPEALDATHNMLGQTEPDYQERLRKAGGQTP